MSGCLNCGPPPERLNLNRNPHPGFGAVSLWRDKELVASSTRYHGSRNLIRAWERRAALNPGHDWVIDIEGPMAGTRYRREGVRKWIAFEQMQGFA